MPNETLTEPEAFCAERHCDWRGPAPALAVCPSCSSRQVRLYDEHYRARAMANALRTARGTFLGIAGSATRRGERALIRTCEIAASRIQSVLDQHGGAL